MISKDDTINKANQLFKSQKFEEALKLVDSYLSEHPAEPAFYTLGANIHLALNHTDQALDYFRSAFGAGLSDEQTLANYSSVLFEQAEYAVSVEVLERLTDLFGERAIYFSNLGYVHHLSGNQLAAIQQCRRAIELDENCIEAYCNLGTALLTNESIDQALSAFEQGIAINPNYAKLHTGIGMVYQQSNRFADAIEAHQQAISLDSMCVEAYCNLGIAQMQCMQADRAVSNFKEALRLNPRFQTAVSNYQLGLQYLPFVPLRQLRTAVRFAASEAIENGKIGSELTRERDTGKLRIGFVSADFYKHPVGYFLRGLLQVSRAEAYEFFCYSNQREFDSFTEAIRESADSWQDVRELSDRNLAETIRADEIDVLVDLSGHTAGNRLGVFAMKPAPIQVSWLGYFASTNTDFIDYMLLSKDQAPQGAEQYYSEKLVRLDCCQFAYFPPEEVVEIHDRAISSAETVAARQASIVFGSFNNVAKIHEELISTWAQIIRSVPRSLLILKWKSFEDELVCDKTIARFQRYGIAKGQLELRGSSAHEDMLNQYNDIDIALDTFPFSGALTSCEALWMGVPVVTMRQLRPVSRQTHAILNSIGLSCLSTRTPAAYVETAIRLASDSEFFGEIKKDLRERLLHASAESQVRLSQELKAFFTNVVNEGSSNLPAE